MIKLLKNKILIFILIFGNLSFQASAEIKLPSIISDNMVMQQNTPVHIWGNALQGEKIKITILKQNISIEANEKGYWETWLAPMKAKNAVSMTISGNNSITINNILIGEVWLASGQSNMEWDVSQSDNADQEIKDANYPLIRLFVPKKGISDTIQTDIEGKWVLCSPETIKNFSAVGYFFGRGLHKKLAVPVGLIEAAWGATNCQSWTALNAIQADPRLNYVTEDWQKIAYRSSQQKKPSKDKPGVIYNAVIAPLSHYTIKGVIWYQGEANAYERVSFPYRYLFPTLIQSWRDAWNQGDFPFLFVQLSTLFKHPYWPVLRESQTETLKLRNTAMAVSIDVGDSTNAHYKNKQAIGYRLELAARNMVYGENIESSGPMFRQKTIENNRIRIWFDHAKGLKPDKSTLLTGFAIAGADGRYLTASATIEGETIVLSNPSISKPVNARYAFKDAPVVNLVNADNLPAVPFRTDIRNGL